MNILLGHQNRKKDWHTIDIFGNPDEKWDLNKGLPKHIKEVENIIGGHLLEHLTYKGAIKLLDDISEVITGELLLEVPDMEGLCKEYLKSTTKAHLHLVLQYIYGNQERKGQFHQWGWDRDTLSEELTRRGFTVHVYPSEREMPSFVVKATK